MDYYLLLIASYTLKVCYHTLLNRVNETNSVSPNFSHSLCLYRVSMYSYSCILRPVGLNFLLKNIVLKPDCEPIDVQYFRAQQCDNIYHVTSSAIGCTFYRICFHTGTAHFSFAADAIAFRSPRHLLPFSSMEIWLLLLC